MTTKPDDPIDWNLTTWKGSRLDQHRKFKALTFAQKLELVEQLSETATFFSKKARSAANVVVNEDPPRTL